jgi:hypothetical protein
LSSSPVASLALGAGSVEFAFVSEAPNVAIPIDIEYIQRWLLSAECGKTKNKESRKTGNPNSFNSCIPAFLIVFVFTSTPFG